MRDHHSFFFFLYSSFHSFSFHTDTHYTRPWRESNRRSRCKISDWSITTQFSEWSSFLLLRLLHLFIIALFSISYRHSLHSTLSTIKSEIKVENIWLKWKRKIQIWNFIGDFYGRWLYFVLLWLFYEFQLYIKRFSCADLSNRKRLYFICLKCWVCGAERDEMCFLYVEYLNDSPKAYINSDWLSKELNRSRSNGKWRVIVLMIVDSTMSSDRRSVRLMLYRLLLNRIIGLKIIEHSIMMVVCLIVSNLGYEFKCDRIDSLTLLANFRHNQCIVTTTNRCLLQLSKILSHDYKIFVITLKKPTLN